MDRCMSGIPGMDELLKGGFMPGSTVLISGGAGTGKTIFCTQFLYNGANEYKEPGIYISFEEGTANIWWNMKSFRWDIAKLQKENLMRVYRVGMFDPKKFGTEFDSELNRIKDLVTEIGAKRLVIDSSTSFGMFMGADSEIRYNMFKLITEMKKLGCTTLLISETAGGRDDYSAFGVEEFVVDGVLMLYFQPPMRAMLVKKMRGTDHDKRVHPFTIAENGFEINPKEQILWEALKK